MSADSEWDSSSHLFAIAVTSHGRTPNAALVPARILLSGPP
jgi:hypothetical protein